MSRSGEETRPSVISSIFGVVGRELQQFVLSAAGINPPIEASKSQSNSPKKVRTKRKAPPVTQDEESDHRRPRKRARTSSPEIIMQQRRIQESPQELSPYANTTTQSHASAQPSSYTRPEYAEDSEIDSQERTPSPPPVRRRATSRMPGALYDLSSPEPESQDDRHVRFASDVISPPLRATSARPPEREHERERPKSRHTEEMPSRLKHRNLQSMASQYSDASYATPPPSTTDSEDIAMSQDVTFDPPVRFSNYRDTSFSNTQPSSSFQRGSLPTHSRTSSLASQSFTDRDAHRSVSILRDDSFSFTSVSERSVEQERISALEEEVRKLKEELSRRSSAPPPPPPPPPPPMLQANRIPTIGQDKGASVVLTSARASLKATPGLAAPTINPSANMKSTVPAAQMAAFLNEMKTVRLRKVSSKPDLKEGSSNSRGPLPLKSSVLDKLGSSSSFSMPRQRHALSQDSVSNQSVGSSFAPSDLSIPSSQTSANATTRISELRTNRVAEPTHSLVSDNGDLVDEEFPPSTPPSVSQLPPVVTGRDRHSIPVLKSSIPSFKASRIPKAPDQQSEGGSRHTSRTVSINDMATTSTNDGEGSSHGVRANAFPNRPTTSGPLPSLSPEKPRPPGRGRASNPSPSKKADHQMSAHSSSDEEDPLSSLASHQQKQQHMEYSVPLRNDDQTTLRSHSTYRSPAPSPSRSRSHSQSRPRESTPSTSTGGNVPSLEAELRKVVRAEVEREFELEIQQLDARAGEVLSGIGLRDSQRDGFMAGGGAGGEPVWMRNGMEDGDGFETERRGGSGRSKQPEQTEQPSPSCWTPVHKPGHNLLYDMALNVIEEDSKRLCARIEMLPEKSPARQELEVLAEMNRPEVVWAAENGKGDMSKPVFRYLAKRRWRERGKLDHLMQRIHTMHVVPDLLADFHPSIDVSLSFGQRGDVEVGTFLDCKTGMNEPTVNVTAFHEDERLYTLVMVDPDVPDVKRQSFYTYLHWLVPNIRISSTTSSPISIGANAKVPYIPPHPANGTPYHRYCVFLFENPNPTAEVDISQAMMDASRSEFDLRKFVAENGFKADQAGGAHFWRQVWDPTVSEIYRERLSPALQEPRYGRPPKVDRYEEVKRVKRYI